MTIIHLFIASLEVSYSAFAYTQLWIDEQVFNITHNSSITHQQCQSNRYSPSYLLFITNCSGLYLSVMVPSKPGEQKQ